MPALPLRPLAYLLVLCWFSVPSKTLAPMVPADVEPSPEARTADHGTRRPDAVRPSLCFLPLKDRKFHCLLDTNIHLGSYGFKPRKEDENHDLPDEL